MPSHRVRTGDNLLLKFSVISLSITVLLALGISAALHSGLSDHLSLLRAHADAMMQGVIPPDAPYAMTNIAARAHELRVTTMLLLAGGFVVLYASLVWIVWGGSRTIRDQKQWFHGVLQALGEGVVVLDDAHRIVFHNERFTELTGWRPEEMHGVHFGDLVTDAAPDRLPRPSADHGQAIVEAGLLNAAFEEPMHVEIRYRYMPDLLGVKHATVCSLIDVTKRKRADESLRSAHRELERKVDDLRRTQRELEAANAQLRHDAFHDRLTGLPNRALFIDRLDHAIRRHNARRCAPYGLLYIDFDRFKAVNDTLGHQVGDAFLVTVAAVLNQCVRDCDTVARMGGDEFSVLMEDIDDEASALKIVQRIHDAFRSPTAIDDHHVQVSASIGVLVGSSDNHTASGALSAADIAMYRAKTAGRGQHCVFQPSMHAEMLARLRVEEDLRGATARGEFETYYFPIVNLEDDTVVGFEALARWNHPRRGLLPPAEFIGIAEECGAIGDIDLWVLRQACAQVRTWQQQCEGFEGLTLSTNLSAYLFEQTDLPATVRRTLQETGFDPRHLRLELTETLMVSSYERLQATFDALKAMGIEIHLDDFGTGYSSLSYLRHLPGDTLKIDRSFVRGIGESSEDYELIQGILTMAGNLGMDVVAEGVENEAQRRSLSALGCRRAQGFHFSPPVTATDAARLLDGCRHSRTPGLPRGQ